MDEPGSVIDTLVPRVPERGIHSRTLHSSADAKVVLFAFAASAPHVDRTRDALMSGSGGISGRGR